jgi:hypothetical protein
LWDLQGGNGPSGFVINCFGLGCFGLGNGIVDLVSLQLVEGGMGIQSLAFTLRLIGSFAVRLSISFYMLPMSSIKSLMRGV